MDEDSPRVARDTHLIGCLLGTAVGDSVGLPAEGLSRQRVGSRFPGAWRQCLVLGRGLLSDDTEHSLLVAQALLASGGDPERFRRSLGWRLRGWLLGLPAGCGFATARAIIRLWLGWPSHRSGVRSAGNGAAMRSAIIGVVYAGNDQLRTRLVREATVVTHRDPRALTGALAVAEVAAWLVRTPGDALDARILWPRLRSLASKNDHDWSDLIDHLVDAWREEHSVDEVATALGLEAGISGYVYHTVPMAIYAALHHLDDSRAALEAIWRCGGDTDTTGAITGALVGTAGGVDGLPREWIDGLADWPRSQRLLRRVGGRLSQDPQHWRPVRYCWPLLPLRNLLFLLVVLGHGFRRLLP